MKLNVLVRDIMTKEIKSVDLEDTVEHAATVMKENNIGSVLVMGEKNMKGILTTQDIVYKHVAAGEGEKVKDIMTRDPVTVAPSQTIEEASRLMVKHNIEKLPVYDAGRLVGIVTQHDVMKVEPALLEILLERAKMGGPKLRGVELDMLECEVCGNYSDDVAEVNGVYTCAECKE